jgi:acetyltransferase-like isoleucine patch superfamily enzyme
VKDIYVHPSAIVETDQIGEGTRIWAYTHVMKDVVVGANCNIGEHCFLESGVTVGDDVTIKNGSLLWEGVHLEDGTFLGPRVTFTNDKYPRSPRLAQARTRYTDRRWLEPTFVRRGASLGAGAIILAGITIEEFCIVGAGATVTRSLPANALAIGSPARVRGWVCRCGQRLPSSPGVATCPDCNLTFIDGGGLVEGRPEFVE